MSLKGKWCMSDVVSLWTLARLYSNPRKPLRSQSLRRTERLKHWALRAMFEANCVGEFQGEAPKCLAEPRVTQ